jgi:hypothetical protein
VSTSALLTANAIGADHVLHAGDLLDVCVGNDVNDINGASRAPPATTLIPDADPQVMKAQQQKLNDPVRSIRHESARRRRCLWTPHTSAALYGPRLSRTADQPQRHGRWQPRRSGASGAHVAPDPTRSADQRKPLGPRAAMARTRTRPRPVIWQSWTGDGVGVVVDDQIEEPEADSDTLTGSEVRVQRPPPLKTTASRPSAATTRCPGRRRPLARPDRLAPRQRQPQRLHKRHRDRSPGGERRPRGDQRARRALPPLPTGMGSTAPRAVVGCGISGIRRSAPAPDGVA